MVLLFFMLLSTAPMDKNHTGTVSLHHSYTRDKTVKKMERFHEQWDLEADIFHFEWPVKERFHCLRKPTVKVAIISGCASVSAAAIAAIGLMVMSLNS